MILVRKRNKNWLKNKSIKTKIIINSFGLRIADAAGFVNFAEESKLNKIFIFAVTAISTHCLILLAADYIFTTKGSLLTEKARNVSWPEESFRMLVHLALRRVSLDVI